MSDKYIPEHRRNQYKAKSTFKPDELRRRREEAQVEIRKAKREENLAKRRGIGTGADRPGASLGAAPDSDDDTAPTESQVSQVVPFYLPRTVTCTLCQRRQALSPQLRPPPTTSNNPTFLSLLLLVIAILHRI
jgi:hypothetical protein